MVGIQTNEELSTHPPYLASGLNQTHSTQITSTQNTSVQHSILPLKNNRKKSLQEEFTILQPFKEPIHSRNKNPFSPKSKPLLNKALPSPLTHSPLLPPNLSYLSELQWQSNKKKPMLQLARQARRHKKSTLSPTIPMVPPKGIPHSYSMEIEAPPKDSWSSSTFSR